MVRMHPPCPGIDVEMAFRIGRYPSPAAFDVCRDAPSVSLLLPLKLHRTFPLDASHLGKLDPSEAQRRDDQP